MPSGVVVNDVYRSQGGPHRPRQTDGAVESRRRRRKEVDCARDVANRMPPFVRSHAIDQRNHEDGACRIGRDPKDNASRSGMDVRSDGDDVRVDELGVPQYFLGGIAGRHRGADARAPWKMTRQHEQSIEQALLDIRRFPIAVPQHVKEPNLGVVRRRQSDRPFDEGTGRQFEGDGAQNFPDHCVFSNDVPRDDEREARTSPAV